MVSLTFQNLKPEKKQVIIEAALNEFSTYPFNEASITNIVKKAGISRGSFYQYFGNKENLYRFLVQYLYLKHRQDLLQLLIKNSGRLYDSLVEFYDAYIDEIVQSKYFNFYKNTFIYVNHHLIGIDGILTMNNQSSDREEQQRQFLELIHMDNLKTDSQKEVLEYIYFIVNTIHHMIIDGFVNEMDFQEIKNRSFRAVDWLYHGIENEIER